MQKILKRSISLLLVILIVLSLFSIGHTGVMGSTHNVYQSRRVASIEEFPESYRLGLQRVKAIYPNARFIYYDTDLDWYNDVLTEENHLRLGVNLIPASSPDSWKSKDPEAYDASTKTYTQVEPGWNQASKAIIEYYMDPRNFFNEKDIFQFMDLSFTGTETVEATQTILNGSFMESKLIKDNNGNDVTYAQALYDAGKEAGVSPYLLACRVRQEQGSGNSALISGTYSKYPGYYNYFNVGAYGSTTEQIITRGLKEAKENGWTSHYKALVGGAHVLASNYVGVGKNCLYLQHFNMTAVNHTVDYRVYMANTLAPHNENKMMSKSLEDKEAAYTFIIPVYDNMPALPCEMPKSNTSEDALLDSLEINDGEVNIGKFAPKTYKYSAAIEPSQQFIILKAKLHNKESAISINGIAVDLHGESVLEKGLMISPGFNDIIITVQAPGGLCRDYQLTIFNDDGSVYYRSEYVDLGETNAIVQPNTTVEKIKNQIQTINSVIYVTDKDGKIKDDETFCVPGDTLMIMNKEQQIVYTAKIAIDGDVNIDGLVTEDDLRLMKEFILEIATLDLAQRDIADINNDGTVDVTDLGLMRIKTGQDFDPQNNDIRIYPNVQDEIIGIKEVEAAVTASSGTYFAEGFLVYNEGRAEVANTENSGKIHFIVDSNKIMFDNSEETLMLKPLINSGNINFSVLIIKAYDYILGETINVQTEPRQVSVKNTDIDVDVTFNEDATEGNKNYHIATIKITNKMNKSTGNIYVDFGHHMTNESKKYNQDFVGLEPGNSHTIKVYLSDGMSSGVYENLIKITYTDAKAVEKMIQIETEFEVMAHDHNGEWKVNDNQHYKECKLCDNAPSEDHKYYRTDNGVYVCTVCGYTKQIKISITHNSARVNSAAVFEPTITINDQPVKIEDFTFVWYVDGIQASQQSYLASIFRSNGKRHIQCVAISKDNHIVVGELDFNPQTTKQAIDVVATSCTSIMIDRDNRYEYRIGSGKWQKSAIFNNLTPGTEYTIYKRKVGESKVEGSIKVYLSHQFGNSIIAGNCGQNLTVENKCSQCGKMIYGILKQVNQEHAFKDYFVEKEATCLSGTIETAKCVYGCGTTDSRVLTDIGDHLFNNYQPDGNASCINAGTETSHCAHGCGTVDTSIVDVSTSGHIYKYVPNNDATVDHSGTETGTCTKCGHVNIRTIDGTRLEYLTNAQLTITNGEQYGVLPSVSILSEGISIKEIVWSDDKNQPADLVNGLQIGSTYKLSKLTIAADDAHIFHETVIVYINGKVFTGTVNKAEKTIELIDVCQIKF